MTNEHFRERRDGMGGPADYQVIGPLAETTFEAEETEVINFDQLRQQHANVLLEQEGV